MDSSNNFLKLLALRIKSSFKATLDYFKSLKYYKNPEFRKADLALMRAYFGVNPYKISRIYLQKQQETEIYAYGETPLTTMEKIATHACFTQNDTIFELGCGRGRTCFWLSTWLGATVVGIDYVPEFIHKAKKINHLPNLTFICEDFLKSDLSSATAIYLHATCMQDPLIEKLNQKLISLKPGLKVITVSFPMSDYDRSHKWKLVASFSADFSWGTAEVYVQLLTPIL